MSDFWLVEPDPDDQEYPDTAWGVFRELGIIMDDLGRAISRLFAHNYLREMLGLSTSCYTHFIVPNSASYKTELSCRPRYSMWFDELEPEVPRTSHPDLRHPSPRSGGCGGLPRVTIPGVNFSVPITPPLPVSWQNPAIKSVHKPP